MKQIIVEKLRELGSKIEFIEHGPSVHFKKIAYYNAAKAIEKIPGDNIAIENLRGVKGVGNSILANIQEIINTGSLSKLNCLQNDLSDLLRIEGVGPSRAQQLFDMYGVKSVSELNALIKNGTIVDEKLSKAIESLLITNNNGLPYNEMLDMARDIELQLKLKCPEAIIEICGSIRRKKAICKDIDIIFAAYKRIQDKGRKAFMELQWDMVLNDGEGKISVFKNGIKVDIRFAPKECYGSLVLFCTGSRDFNIATRSIAKSKGFKLNEYGLFRGTELVTCVREEDIFEALGLKYISPEKRENCDLLY